MQQNANVYICFYLSCVFFQTQTCDPAPVEAQEKPFPHQQQQNIKQRLVNVYVSFFYLPLSCYGQRLDSVDVSLSSENLPPANKRAVCLGQCIYGHLKPHESQSSVY